jgi:nucleotide-binding universal stress UspA family protein
MDGFGGSYVLAGFDGSPGSVLALGWAAGEARLRRLPLIVCHAWHWPYAIPRFGSLTRDALRQMAQQLLDEGVRIAHEVAPHTTVCGHLEAGPTSAILVNDSRDAAVAVVGAHGQGGFPGLRTGSSAAQLPAYAHCPVIVVRNIAEPVGPVVVGVDSASEVALAFGFEEAALRERPLRVVHAWGPETTVADEARIAAGGLELTTSLWREKYPRVDAETVLVAGPAQQALLEAAEGAGLLVVGGGGLGAVGGAVVQHAPCPVAVVRSAT